MKTIAFAVAALLASARLAGASERLSDSGSTVLSGQLDLTASNLGATPGGWTLALSPGADIIVWHGLSLGAALAANLTFFAEGWGGSVGLTPRVGYVIPLGERFALWPRGAIGYEHRFLRWANAGLAANMNVDLVSVLAEAPLTVELVPHMFLSFGPYVSKVIRQSSPGVLFADVPFAGLRAGIGGYFF